MPVLCENSAVDRGRGYYRWARKLLHIFGGAGAFTLPFIPYWLALSGALGAMVVALLLKPHHVWWLRVMSKPADRIRGVITGLRGYCLAVLLLVLLWPLLEIYRPDAVRFVMIGWLALALGDGLAGLIGPGPSVSATVFWSKQKTWWGFFGCFVGTLAACLICLAPPWQGVPGLPLATAMAHGAIIAIITALLESSETNFDDNYLVGLAPPFMALGLAAVTA